MQVGLDLQPRSAAEARAINLQILHDPLHVISCFGERDQFDPVDHVDFWIAVNTQAVVTHDMRYRAVRTRTARLDKMRTVAEPNSITQPEQVRK
jgi:hypothetical protein